MVCYCSHPQPLFFLDIFINISKMQENTGKYSPSILRAKYLEICTPRWGGFLCVLNAQHERMRRLSGAWAGGTARPQQVEPARPPGERNGPASKADVFRRGSPSLTWGVIFSTKEGGLCGDGMRDPQTFTEPGGREVWGG